MQPKDITFDLEKVLKGLNITANVVKATLGPGGKNVMVDDPMEPKISNDGVFIANSIVFEDKNENLGAYWVKNTASQTNDNAGDGTTTTALLLQKVIEECLKRPESPIEIRKSLNLATEEVVKQIKKQSKEIKNDNQIRQVATVSAENDEHGQMIADIIKKVGKKGVITVEDSRTYHTDYDIVEGYEAQVGFMSPYFVTDKEEAKAIYEKVRVVVFEHKISTVSDIKYLGEVLQAEKIDKIVIVCSDIDTAMLNNFIMNHVAPQGLKNVVIRAASRDLLEDIAASVGATVVGGEAGVTYDKITPAHLGFADKVVVTEKSSIFFRKGGKTQEAQSKRLQKLAETNVNPYEKSKYLERASKLKGQIAVIRVGAPTDGEKWYLKHKLEDAVNATQSAIEEGIVEGGGMALYRIGASLKPNTIGHQILKEVLKAPFKTILENSAKDYAEIVMNMPKDKGYNAKTDKYENLFESGIIDPAKVERCALENAVSTAGVIITTHAVITEKKNDNKKE